MWMRMWNAKRTEPYQGNVQNAEVGVCLVSVRVEVYREIYMDISRTLSFLHKWAMNI